MCSTQSTSYDDLVSKLNGSLSNFRFEDKVLDLYGSLYGHDGTE